MKYFLFIFVAVLMSLSARADLVVVVNSKYSAGISLEQLQKIFQSQSSELEGGVQAAPVDLSMDDPVRSDFSSKYLGKSIVQLKSYWSRMIFTGRGLPPTEMPSQEAVKKWVSEKPGGIGYLDAKWVDNTVRVIVPVGYEPNKG